MSEIWVVERKNAVNGWLPLEWYFDEENAKDRERDLNIALSATFRVVRYTPEVPSE